jgi:hypothetical protein
MNLLMNDLRFRTRRDVLLFVQVIVKVVVFVRFPVKKVPPLILFGPAQPFVPLVALHEVALETFHVSVTDSL